MSPRTLPVLVFVIACGHPSTKPVEPEQTEFAAVPVDGCVPFGTPALYGFSYPSETGDHAASYAADGAAKAAFDAGLAAAEAKHYAEAARHYLECAGHYRVIPDTDSAIETVKKNAGLCYDTAMYAFASAGRFAEEGQAALEKAAIDDPRLASVIRDKLAKPPHDCEVK